MAQEEEVNKWENPATGPKVLCCFRIDFIETPQWLALATDQENVESGPRSEFASRAEPSRRRPRPSYVRNTFPRLKELAKARFCQSICLHTSNCVSKMSSILRYLTTHKKLRFAINFQISASAASGRIDATAVRWANLLPFVCVAAKDQTYGLTIPLVLLHTGLEADKILQTHNQSCPHLRKQLRVLRSMRTLIQAL